MQIRRRNPGAQHTSHCARNRYGDASNIVSVLTQRARDRSQDAHTFPRPQAHLRQTPTSPHRATRHQRHTADTHATHDATSPTLHNGTSAMSRVSQKRTKTNNAPHTTHSHAAYKHTSPARPQDIPHSRNHCALRNHHRMHNAARTPHTARHTAPTTPHATHTKSHPVTHAASAPHSLQSCQAAQRRRDAAGELVVVHVKRPAGHTISHRVTPWHSTPRPAPASLPQRISAHRIASIKSSQMTSQSAHCMLSLTHSTVRE